MKFICDSNGRYFNARLNTEIEKRRAYCRSRGENKLGKRLSKNKIQQKSCDNHMKSYDNHMGNGNRNGDKEKEGPGEKENWTPPAHLAEIWPHFEEHRRKLRKPMTDRARQGIVRELAKLSADEAIQVKILDQSITMGWQGVFALRAQAGSDGWQ
jgi:hypothetical protein